MPPRAANGASRHLTRQDNPNCEVVIALMATQFVCPSCTQMQAATHIPVEMLRLVLSRARSKINLDSKSRTVNISTTSTSLHKMDRSDLSAMLSLHGPIIRRFAYVMSNEGNLYRRKIVLIYTSKIHLVCMNKVDQWCYNKHVCTLVGGKNRYT